MSRLLPSRSWNNMKPSSQVRHQKLSKLLFGALLAGSLLGTATTSAANDRQVATERFTEYAPVIDVQPIYREVRTREPRQECWTEEQQVIVGQQQVVPQGRYRSSESKGSSAGNAVVGGLIGGVIGNQLGRGNSSQSRAGATVAGAIIGGVIANEAGGQVSRHRSYERAQQIETRPIYETQTVERCKQIVTSQVQPRLQHYNVTYRYKGRDFVTQLPRDPGAQIELQVTVAPARR